MPPLSKIKFVVPKELAKYLSKDVPREARLMSARGTLPLQPKDLAIVLFYLAYDADPEIKSTAEKTLINMPDPVKKTLLDSHETHPLILDFMARRLDQDSPLLESIALNRVTHDQTVEYMATLPAKRLVDIIANNQTRILRHPPIVDALGNNPMVGQATIERILHFVQLETGIKEEEEEKVAVPEPTEEEQPQEEVPDYMQDEEYPWMDEEEEVPDHWAIVDLPPELTDDPEEELTEEEIRNMSRRISKMSISEKIKMAMLGNKEARSILIKDTNKIVASAVLASPKLTDGEVESISKSRTVSEDIIRQISNNPEWTRNYAIKLNLVQNNKTPIQTAIKYLNYLTQRDLNQTSKSKNIPGPVATAAKKLIQKRREG